MYVTFNAWSGKGTHLVGLAGLMNRALISGGNLGHTSVEVTLPKDNGTEAFINELKSKGTKLQISEVSEYVSEKKKKEFSLIHAF